MLHIIPVYKAQNFRLYQALQKCKCRDTQNTKYTKYIKWTQHRHTTHTERKRENEAHTCGQTDRQTHTHTHSRERGVGIICLKIDERCRQTHTDPHTHTTSCCTISNKTQTRVPKIGDLHPVECLPNLEHSQWTSRILELSASDKSKQEAKKLYSRCQYSQFAR